MRGKSLKNILGMGLALFLTTGFARGQACAVTQPNEQGVHPTLYGNGALSAVLQPEGTVVFKPGGGGFVTGDGALGIKWAWRRGVNGQLKIEGRRLDGPAPPLRAEIPGGYGDTGWIPTYVIFPQPGCWEVTGSVGNARITFVTRVIKIGEGPSARR